MKLCKKNQQCFSANGTDGATKYMYSTFAPLFQVPLQSASLHSTLRFPMQLLEKKSNK